MEPIVSPWMIYLLGLLDGAGLDFITIFCCVFGTAAVILYWALVATCERNGEEFRRFQKNGKWFIRIIHVLLVFSFAFQTLVPSRDTVLMMIAAKHITPNNITKAVQAGSDWKEALKADVIEIIQAVQGPEEKGNE